jgi:predicted PurR-regulated permease PerM
MRRRAHSSSPAPVVRRRAAVPAAPSAPPLAAPRGRWERLLWGVGFVVVGAALFWLLRPVFALLAASAGLAYLLDPLVDALERRGLSRESGIGVLFAAFVGGVVLVLLVGIPTLGVQLERLSAQLTPFFSNLDTTLAPALAEVSRLSGRPVTLDLAALQTQAPRWIQENLPRVQAGASTLAEGLFTQGLGLINALVNLTLLPVFLFYLLRDWDRLVAAIGGLVPVRHRGRVERVAREVDLRLSAFVRGQITVCLAMAALYSVGLVLVGIDLAVPIGLMSGLLVVVPYLGSAVGLGASLVLALMKFGLGAELIQVLVVFVVVQGIEGYLLTPRIVGDKVGLHPLVVMVALIVGGSLLGIWGMLLAIPVTAVLSVFAAEWLSAYRESTVFGGASRE